MTEGKRIFVGSLNKDIDEKQLQTHFAVFGVITKCLVMRSTNSGMSRKFGFVEFAEEKYAKAALLERSRLISGNKITVGRAYEIKKKLCDVGSNSNPSTDCKKSSGCRKRTISNSPHREDDLPVSKKMKAQDTDAGHITTFNAVSYCDTSTQTDSL